MSIRAYRLIKIETEDEISFNLWSEEGMKIQSYLGLYDGLDSDGGGLVSADADDVERMLNDEERGFDIEPDTRQALERDIKTTRAQGDNWVEWFCY